MFVYIAEVPREIFPFVFYGILFLVILSVKIKDIIRQKIDRPSYNVQYYNSFFIKFKKSWSKNDLDSIYNLKITEKFFKKTRRISNKYSQNNIKNIFDDIKLDSTEIDTTSHINIVCVTYSGHAKDYFVSTTSNKIVNYRGRILKTQTTHSEFFREKWYFKVINGDLYLNRINFDYIDIDANIL